MPGQVAAIALYTQFQHPPSPAVVSSLEEGVGSIAAPLGLDLEWKSLAAFHGGDTSTRLVLMTFHGSCSARDLLPGSHTPGGLGWTHVTDGELLPFIDIDCDRIRNFLHTPLFLTDLAGRERVLGRAVGGVIAHELYHVLGRTVRHGNGLADHPAYTVHELTDEDTPIDQTGCRIRHLDHAPAAPTVSNARSRSQPAFVEKQCAVCHGSQGEGTHRGPALRGLARPADALELATRLGINAHAMCRAAGHLKIQPPSLDKGDLDRLVQFLNAF
jgi:hypothetical protein